MSADHKVVEYTSPDLQIIKNIKKDVAKRTIVCTGLTYYAQTEIIDKICAWLADHPK